MLNIPNFLSVARIIFVPLFIILLINRFFGWALLVFLAAAITDAVDGLLARLLHQRTILGSYLDPAADKLLTASSFITLAILNILPGWLAVVVISRDVIIALGIMIFHWTSHPLEMRPSLASKITTVFQFCTVIAALLSKPPSFMDLLIWGTGVSTVVSGLQYIWKGVKILNQ
jgi:cardiolipin synthase